jgi:N-methylhydantoinase A
VLGATYRVGVDIGGTFTDVVVVGPNGEWRVGKANSTPPTYVEGLLRGLYAAGVDAKDIRYFAHGTTVATNAVIERRGARTGLITTAGFEDVLEVARESWEVQWDYWWRPPPPLVHRLLRLGVKERIDASGEVLIELDKDSVREAIALLKDRGAEAIAVCLLHSYVNPCHEQSIRSILLKEDDSLPVYLSSEICPEVGEFERTSTTVVSAFVGPKLADYLSHLQTGLREKEYRGDISVMTSSGGVMTVSSARKAPAHLLHSGLAAGVMAGVEIARLTGESNLITLDIGGTSADMAVISNGVPRLIPEHSVSFNVPIRAPTVDVHTIGAGGGSIAWIDSGGALKVGPQSAGSSPGPVCYGQGGQEPTLTDALLVLGHLVTEGWADRYGWAIDLQAARNAINNRVGVPLAMSLVESADAIREVVLHNLVQAIRLVSIERGYDPRDFSLVAYGGAGPLVAVDVARELHIKRVIIPMVPGVTSALGLLQSDLRVDAVRSVVSRAEGLHFGELNVAHNTMVEEILGQLEGEGADRASIQISRFIDIRNYGQAHYITVPMAANESLSPATWERLVAKFDLEHEREYGYVMPITLRQRELANLRVVGLVPRERVSLAHRPPSADRPLRRQMTSAYFRGFGHLATTIVARDALVIGDTLPGPAIITQADTTTIVPPKTIARADKTGNLEIWSEEAASLKGVSR